MDNAQFLLIKERICDDVCRCVYEDTVFNEVQDSVAEPITMVPEPVAAASASAPAPKTSKKSAEAISRRGLIGGAAAVIVGAGGAIAVPLMSQASEAAPATVDDIAQLEYELSMLTKSASDAEILAHKTLTVNADSTDLQYPSAKAVYNAMADKVDIFQGTDYSGYIFIVGEDGRLKLSKFTSDELSETETLPVENRVIYKELKDIMRALSNLDLIPMKDSTRGVESGGVYETYQETKEISDFGEVKMGINYKYTGKGINNSDGVYSVRMIDTVMVAVNQSDPSLVYTSVDKGTTWGAPYGGW